MEINLEARRKEPNGDPTGFHAQERPKPTSTGAGRKSRSPNGQSVIPSSSKSTCERRRDAHRPGEGVQLGTGESVSYLLGRTETGPRPLAFSHYMMNVA